MSEKKVTIYTAEGGWIVEYAIYGQMGDATRVFTDWKSLCLFLGEKLDASKDVTPYGPQSPTPSFPDPSLLLCSYCTNDPHLMGTEHTEPMKCNINANDHYPQWVCHECAMDAGGSAPVCATYHEDLCGACGRLVSCTEPRDYGYPDFGKLKAGYKQAMDSVKLRRGKKK